jgi:hypothetical protein
MEETGIKHFDFLKEDALKFIKPPLGVVSMLCRVKSKVPALQESETEQKNR